MSSSAEGEHPRQTYTQAHSHLNTNLWSIVLLTVRPSRKQQNES